MVHYVIGTQPLYGQMMTFLVQTENDYTSTAGCCFFHLLVYFILYTRIYDAYCTSSFLLEYDIRRIICDFFFFLIRSMRKKKIIKKSYASRTLSCGEVVRRINTHTRARIYDMIHTVVRYIVSSKRSVARTSLRYARNRQLLRERARILAAYDVRYVHAYEIIVSYT